MFRTRPQHSAGFRRRGRRAAPSPVPAPALTAMAEPPRPAEATASDLFQVRAYMPSPAGPDPLTDPEFPATESAVLAHGCSRQDVLRVRCGGPGPAGDGCPVTAGRGSTRSFAAVYGWASAGRWARDVFGTWTCPECQMLPTWRTPRGLSPLGRDAHEAGAGEACIIENTHAAAGTPAQFAAALKAVA